MASWSTDAPVFMPVRIARRAWERTQPQLFLELEDLPEAAASLGQEQRPSPLSAALIPSLRQTPTHTTSRPAHSSDGNAAPGGQKGTA